VVHAYNLAAGDLLNHCFHDRPRSCDQLRPDLFEQIFPLLGRKCLDQLLLGRGQHALQSDHEEITDQVSVDVLGAAAHVLLFEARHPLADEGFDFSLALHDDLKQVSADAANATPSKAVPGNKIRCPVGIPSPGMSHPFVFNRTSVRVPR
jgi:hypothetical protein